MPSTPPIESDESDRRTTPLPMIAVPSSRPAFNCRFAAHRFEALEVQALHAESACAFQRCNGIPGLMLPKRTSLLSIGASSAGARGACPLLLPSVLEKRKGPPSTLCSRDMPGGIIIDNAKKGDAVKLKVPALHSSLVKVLAQCRGCGRRLLWRVVATPTRRMSLGMGAPR